MAKAASQHSSTLENSYPNPDGDPMPPGPWDPIIRQALDRMTTPTEDWHSLIEQARREIVAQFIGNAIPEAWDAINPMHSVALNPQPLPPKWKFPVEFARAAMDRFETIQETAEIIGGEDGGNRSIIVVGGKISSFVDDWCGTVPKRWPGPRPKGLYGEELVLMGMEFIRGSKLVSNSELAGQFAAAGRQLMEEGTNRL